MEHLDELFKRLQASGLTIIKSKCEFMKDEIKIFGIKLSSNGIKPDEDKISVLRNAPPPFNVAEIRSFLGSFTRVIPIYSEYFE